MNEVVVTPPEAEEREEELVAQTVEEQGEDLHDQLGLDNVPEGDEALEERIRTGTVTETDMINKARTELFKKLGELGVRDIATVYITGLRLEEARLKSRIKEGDKDQGARTMREKMRRAMTSRGEDDD